MKKSEFINSLSKKLEKTGIELSKKQIDTIFRMIFEEITLLLKKKIAFMVPSFGTFRTKKRSARKGRNPQTGEVINIKAKTVPVFSASAALKEEVK